MKPVVGRHFLTIGFFTSLVAVLFKIQHWQGANLLQMAAAALFVLGCVLLGVAMFRPLKPKK